MVHIHHAAECAAPLPFAFDYVDDYRNVPEWLYGVSEFVPVGELDRGLGARFDGVVRLGPATLRSTVRTTGWEEGSVITLESVRGFRNESTWRFDAVSEERTRISVDLVYELPGGLAGKALGRVIEPFVTIGIKQTDAALRANIERHYRSEQH